MAYRPLTIIFNNCVNMSVFPALCKQADVSPIYKKADPLLKTNYRPVSVLTTISKVFERLLENQLLTFQSAVLNPATSAFRSGHICQSVLLSLTENIRTSLDAGLHAGMILMDLSKAFDSIPHPLLLSKLSAYGASVHAIRMLASYLRHRKQRVKLSGGVSDWVSITKGVPQGSVLGPMLFNLFANDLFGVFQSASLYNYADDNTLLAIADSITEVKEVLKSESLKAIEWFSDNFGLVII